MKARHLFTLTASVGAFVLAAGSAMADELPANGAPLTRAQVVQSVIDARAAGQLQPAGEAGDESPADMQAFHSTLSRAEVEHQVVAARAAGELQPAGEAGEDDFPVAMPSGSGMTRAQVVAETMKARDAGLLVLPGEGDLMDYSRDVQQHQYAVSHAHHAAPAVVTQ